MADTPTPKATPSRFTGWKKKLTIGTGVLVALLIVVYFVATSAAFLKGFVLPRASKTLNAKITVEDASISPFSAVSLTGLKVETTGDPLLEAKSAQLRYSLWDIIGGRVNVSEMTIEGASVKIVKNADGTSNLDQILQALNKSEKESSPKAAKTSTPPQLDLKNIALKNAAFSFVQHLTNNGLQTIELAAINLNVDQVRNGISGKVTLSTEVNFEQKLATPAAHNLISTKAAANFDFAITSDLKLQSLKGNTKLEVGKVLGGFQEFAAAGAQLDCELTPTEIKQLALKFSQAGNNLGTLQVSGPLDPAKLEGKLKVDILSIDKRVLNLAGTPLGIDFGTTQLNCTNIITIEKGAKLVSVNGKLNINQLSVSQKGNTTVPLDFAADYDVKWDSDAKQVLLNNFLLDGRQKSGQLLRASLAKPMKISLKEGGDAVDESALSLELTGFNLADWKPFVGNIAPAGLVNVTLNILSQKAGQNLSVKTDMRVQDLALNLGSNHISNADISLTANTTVEGFKQINVLGYRAQLSLQKKAALTSTGIAKYNIASGEADAQPQVQVNFAPLLAAFPVPGFNAESGSLQFNGQVNQKVSISGKETNTVQTLGGTLAVTDFTGSFTNCHWEKLSISLEPGITIKNMQDVQIAKLGGTIAMGKAPGSTFAVSGNYNLKKGAGQLDLKLANLNESIVRPFVSAALGDMTLQSMNLNVNASAGYDPAGETKVKADVQLTNLLLKDKAGKLPAEPLALSVKTDLSAFEVASPKTLRAQIRQLAGSINQGDKLAGKFDVSGDYDAKKQAGKFSAKLQNLNELALRPALASALGNKTLESINIEVTADGSYSASGASSVKADVQLANLVIKDPAGQFPATPLSVKVGVDGSLDKNVVDLKQAQLSLTPTDRAKNVLTLSGRVDMSKTNIYSGGLKLAADSLDVTPYYNMFVGTTEPQAKAKPAPKATEAAKPEEEPAPIQLPLQNFTFDMNVGHFYLREVAIENVVSSTKLDVSHVVLNPFKLTYNGAPVSATADLNLSMPGYQYDVSLDAKKLPIEPLANTFSPQYKGAAKGDLFADIHVKGAGTTGANLKKNLNGQISLNFTNANIKLPLSGTAHFTLDLVSGILRIPELTGTPLDNAGALLKFGGGQIDVQQFKLHSPLMIATTQGIIPINDDLMSSPLNLPITVYLPSNLAKKFKVTGRAPNEPYEQLPVFITVKGTLGNPDPKKDLVAIGLLTAGAVGGLPANVEEGVQKTIENNVINGINSLFKKKK